VFLLGGEGRGGIIETVLIVLQVAVQAACGGVWPLGAFNIVVELPAAAPAARYPALIPAEGPSSQKVEWQQQLLVIRASSPRCWQDRP
jgi:hypothetical protein